MKIPANTSLLLQQKLIIRANDASKTDIKKSVQINSKLFKMILALHNSFKLKADFTVLLNKLLKLMQLLKFQMEWQKKLFPYK
jgi:hypothetical protein